MKRIARSNEARRIDQTRRKLSLGAAVAGVLTCLAVAETPRADSLAQHVPPQVGIFVEIREAEDLLTALLEPQLWSTLAQIAGQPAGPEDTLKWRELIVGTVKMEPAEAIRTLFHEGVAFVGEGLGRAQDAVVICRPARGDSPDQWLARWAAQKIDRDARPARYWLHRNIGVAPYQDLLIFGDLLPVDGMLQQVLDGLRRNDKRLADDPTYRKLLARVPDRPDGVVFMRLTPYVGPSSQPTTGPAADSPTTQGANPPGTRLTSRPVPQPSSRPVSRAGLADLPGPLGNSENIMFALHREGSLLHFTAVGDGPGRSPIASSAPKINVGSAPLRSLLVWEGRVDYAGLVESLRGMPDENVMRIALRLLEPFGTVERLLGSLGSSTCLTVGLVNPDHRAAEAPPVPAVGLLVAARDERAVADEFKAAIESFVTVYNFASLRAGLPPLPLVREVLFEATRGYVVDLSRALTSVEGAAAIGELHLCWAVHDGVLILTTHEDWMRQIVRAREGKADDLSEVLRLPERGVAPTSENVIVVQMGPISDVGSAWIEHLRRTAPQVLREDWWRDRQPGRGAVQLGIDVTREPANRRLRIRTVQPNTPADGRLRVGDYVVGCNDRRFVSDRPAREIRRAIRQRPVAGWVDLLIERDGVIRLVRLPLPFVNPVASLQRLVALGKLAQRIIYHDDVPSPEGSRGFLTIELRTSPKPLFEIDAAGGESANPQR